jgi:hypothetical protein
MNFMEAVKEMEKYKFAIINKNTVTLTNNATHLPCFEDIIENPKIKIKGNLLYLNGNMRQYRLNSHHDINDINLVEDKDIRPKYKFLFLTIPASIKSGWVLLKRRKPYKTIISPFILEER